MNEPNVNIDDIIAKLSCIPGILGLKAYERSHPGGRYDPSCDCYDEYAAIAGAVDEAIDLLSELKNKNE